MKHFFLVLFLLTCACSAEARNSTDSLLSELNKAEGDLRKKAGVLGWLCFAYKGINARKALEYGREAIDLAAKGNYKKELASAYVFMAFASESSGQVDRAFNLLDSARPYISEAAPTMAYYHESLRGNLYRRKAAFDKALEHFLRAAKIAEDSKDEFLEARAYNALGTFHTTLHDLDKAEQYHLKALEIRKRLGLPFDIYQSYDNLGIVHRSKKNYDKALEYYFKALEYAIIGDDSSNISFVYNDVGAAYSFKGDLQNAERYLKASIRIREQMNELNELAYTYNYLGENYEKKGNLDSAERYIKKALALAIQIGNTKQNYEAFESLSDFYSRHGRFDSAYKYIMAYRHLKDSVTTLKQSETIAELNTRYETTKKEHQIKEQQFQITRKNYWIAGILFVLFMGGLLAYSGFRRHKLKQKASMQAAIFRQQELATKAVIEAEEKERKRIAGDLHDGIGQMMSAAKMNLSSLSNEITFADEDQQLAFEKAISLVDDSCREVRTVSHNIMPNALLKSGLALAIREFLNKIDHRVINVNLYTEGLNERIETNTETVLYRVVQECVNNVIKHSGATQLDITLLKDEDGISITIEDNGKGFDPKVSMEGEGIGLKNIITRITYLKGTAEWDSAPGKGTVVVLQVPDARNG